MQVRVLLELSPFSRQLVPLHSAHKARHRSLVLVCARYHRQGEWLRQLPRLLLPIAALLLGRSRFSCGTRSSHHSLVTSDNAYLFDVVPIQLHVPRPGLLLLPNYHLTDNAILLGHQHNRMGNRGGTPSGRSAPHVHPQLPWHAVSHGSHELRLLL